MLSGSSFTPQKNKPGTSNHQNEEKKINLIKPDFSQIFLKENQFFPKVNYSDKIRKISLPESPEKNQNKNPYSYNTIKGRDLFGAKNDNIKKFSKKINFDEVKVKDTNLFNGFLKSKEHEIEFNNKNNQIEKGLDKKIIIRENESFIDNNYTIIQTLSKNKSDAVYKVTENSTNKIFCLKKISENSNKNNFNILITTIEDIQKNNIDWKFERTFCIKYINYWIENKNLNINKEDRNYIKKNIYILTEYYKKGDVLDYLFQLEKNNFIFTPNFYWDLIFEMIMGLLYIHQKGYIHLDIKPKNYLVDNEGFLFLIDFGLSLKEKEIINLDDIIEGDSKYISKELFDNSLKKINHKVDIFSLGLTILEILAKIDLPSNGQLWKKLRDSGKDIIDNNIFKNSNITNCEEFFDLIKKMISPINERPDIIELLEKTNELNKRYELLKKNLYKKSFVF